MAFTNWKKILIILAWHICYEFMISYEYDYILIQQFLSYKILQYIVNYTITRTNLPRFTVWWILFIVLLLLFFLNLVIFKINLYIHKNTYEYVHLQLIDETKSLLCVKCIITLGLYPGQSLLSLCNYLIMPPNLHMSHKLSSDIQYH